jgi:hypothetical protein
VVGIVEHLGATWSRNSFLILKGCAAFMILFCAMTDEHVGMLKQLVYKSMLLSNVKMLSNFKG